MTLKTLLDGPLQEWVADERGYFTAEGLEYNFLPEGDYGIHTVRRDGSGEIRTGAFETFGAGRDWAYASCACHWATSAAASGGAGQPATSAYSVAPGAIMVPPKLAGPAPRRLRRGAGGGRVPLGEPLRHPAGARSGAGSWPGQPHLSGTAQRAALRTAGTGRSRPARCGGCRSTWPRPLGFRKVLDATFMIGFLVSSARVSKADVDKYLAALRRAQQEIDLHPEAYKHYHLRAVPEEVPRPGGRAGLRHRGADRLPALHQGGLRRDPGMGAEPGPAPGDVGLPVSTSEAALA